VEQALSDLWGGKVRLAISERIEEHEHVIRLALRAEPLGAPQTAILKRWREEDEERFDQNLSMDHFHNDWAGIKFLMDTLGDASPAPKIYLGNSLHAIS